MKKKILTAVIAAGVILAGCSAKEKATPESFIEDISGTYVELYSVLTEDAYRQDWTEAMEGAVKESEIDSTLDAYFKMFTGTLIGDDAVIAYQIDNEDLQYNCSFTHDLASITIDGLMISGQDEQGNEIFSHTYEVYTPEKEDDEHMFYVSTDPDSGDFTYFMFATEDTPEEYYHIEFRFGDSLDDMTEIDSGVYAYWMAAGIPADADDDFIRSCIEMYTDELF